MRRLSTLLLLVALSLLLTRPDEPSFRRFLVSEANKRDSQFLRSLAYSPRLDLRQRDFVLARYASLPGIGGAEFVGAWGTWWPVPRAGKGKGWTAWVPACSGGCGPGVCVGAESCLCLPGHTGRGCSATVPQFRSLGPRLPKERMASVRGFLEAAGKWGAPEWALDAAEGAAEAVSDALDQATVMEAIMVLMVGMYVAGTVFASPFPAMRARFDAFASSSPARFNPAGLLLANFNSNSLADLLLNLGFFVHFAPAAYARLGERRFLYLVGACCLAAQGASLLWRNISGNSRRSAAGASGWVVGLESYVLAAVAGSSAYAQGPLFVVRESVLRHLMLDLIVNGRRSDWAAAVGGFVGGVLFLRFADSRVVY
ncbi:hypothetical protein DFJ74DRAFT_505219 [Hyaloraphidium curvatum]|nr:hypothetical protein DFJ74DRAFT_505219 [Hyaloraphidium curvatum]